MENDLISVIVPIYNVEKYLQECLDSIINQTYKNLEIILVDDGSTDNSGIICNEYAKKDNRIKVIHKKNGGLSSARNAGMDECSVGGYITFVDSDDWLELDTYELAYKTIVDFNADIVAYNFFVDFKNTSLFDENFQQYCICDNEIVDKIYTNNYYSTVIWNKLYKKDLFKDIRFPLNCVFEYWYVYLPLLENCNKLVIVSDKMYHYRQRINSIVNSKVFDERYLNIIDYSKKRYQYIKENHPKLSDIAKEDVLRSYVTVAEKISFSTDAYEYKNVLKKIQSKLRSEIFSVLFSNNHSNVSKIKILVLAFNSKLYKFLLKTRRRKLVPFD